LNYYRFVEEKKIVDLENKKIQESQRNLEEKIENKFMKEIYKLIKKVKEINDNTVFRRERRKNLLKKTLEEEMKYLEDDILILLNMVLIEGQEKTNLKTVNSYKSGEHSENENDIEEGYERESKESKKLKGNEIIVNDESHTYFLTESPRIINISKPLVQPSELSRPSTTNSVSSISDSNFPGSALADSLSAPYFSPFSSFSKDKIRPYTSPYSDISLSSPSFQPDSSDRIIHSSYSSSPASYSLSTLRYSSSSISGNDDVNLNKEDGKFKYLKKNEGLKQSTILKKSSENNYKNSLKKELGDFENDEIGNMVPEKKVFPNSNVEKMHNNEKVLESTNYFFNEKVDLRISDIVSEMQKKQLLDRNLVMDLIQRKEEFGIGINLKEKDENKTMSVNDDIIKINEINKNECDIQESVVKKLDDVYFENKQENKQNGVSNDKISSDVKSLFRELNELDNINHKKKINSVRMEEDTVSCTNPIFNDRELSPLLNSHTLKSSATNSVGFSYFVLPTKPSVPKFDSFIPRSFLKKTKLNDLQMNNTNFLKDHPNEQDKSEVKNGIIKQKDGDFSTLRTMNLQLSDNILPKKSVSPEILSENQPIIPSDVFLKFQLSQMKEDLKFRNKHEKELFDTDGFPLTNTPPFEFLFCIFIYVFLLVFVI
jgi:hypothetical protein